MADGTWQYEYTYDVDEYNSKYKEYQDALKEYNDWESNIADKHRKEELEKEKEYEQELLKTIDDTYTKEYDKLEEHYKDINTLVTTEMDNLNAKFGENWDTIYQTIKTRIDNIKALIASLDGTTIDIPDNSGDNNSSNTNNIVKPDNISSDTWEQMSQQMKEYARKMYDYEKAKNGYAATSIGAPISGVIQNINARAGEDASVTIQTYGYLAQIQPDGGTVSFIYTGDQTLEEGDALYVSKAGGPMLESELTDKESGKLTIDVYEGQLDASEIVSVYTRDGAYLGSAYFQKYQPVTVSGAGKIASIPVKENEHVQRGQTVFTLQSNDVSTAVSLAEITLSQAQRNLDDALSRRDSPEAQIIAPADGVIAAINVSEGNRVEKSAAAFTLNETDKIQAVVMVDEMDIVNVYVGQKATVTVDALPDKEYSAVVERFSHSGTVTGGVTQYQVTLTVDNPEGILLDMSVSAEILVDQRTDILRIPSEALITLDGKYYVLSADIAGKRFAKTQDYLIPVEIGLATESYIEILSGVSEGQSLAVEVSDNYTTRMMRLMGGGGME
jgi:HlyD family secretion protein